MTGTRGGSGGAQGIRSGGKRRPACGGSAGRSGPEKAGRGTVFCSQLLTTEEAVERAGEDECFVGPLVPHAQLRSAQLCV